MARAKWSITSAASISESFLRTQLFSLSSNVPSDGDYLWATLSQHRPNSTTTVFRIDPLTLIPIAMFAVDDHLGAIVSDGEGKLAMATWGSRKWTHIDPNKDRLVPLPNFTPLKFIRNPSHFVDYQDAKYLGTVAGIGNGPLAICGGLNQYDNLRLGGIAIMDIETAIPIMEIPVAVTTEHGYSLC